MALSLDVEPIDATFGAVLRNIDVRNLDDALAETLYAAWLNYALLVFPALHLTMQEQEVFARHFGDAVNPTFAISNVNPDGSMRTNENGGAYDLDMLRGNHDWHADGTYAPVQAKGAIYSAQLVPAEGGQTGWADMRAAYDELDAETRRVVDHGIAHHSIKYSQARRGLLQQDRPSAIGAPVNPARPMVKLHPETGRRSLLIGRHANNVEGMTEEQSEAFLDALLARACSPPRVYFHDWAPGDLVVWDNRCLLHCVKPWDLSQPRIMWHTGLSGDPVSEGVQA